MSYLALHSLCALGEVVISERRGGGEPDFPSNAAAEKKVIIHFCYITISNFCQCEWIIGLLDLLWPEHT